MEESAKTVNLKQVAYHEAGHAVMCYLKNTEFEYVTIEPSGNSLGAVGEVSWGLLGDNAESRVRAFSAIADRVAILYSGAVSQLLYNESCDLETLSTHISLRLNDGLDNEKLDVTLTDCSSDFDKAEELLRRIAPPEQMDEWESAYMGDTAWFLSAHWTAVVFLAEAILEERTMTAERARQIIKQAMELADSIENKGQDYDDVSNAKETGHSRF